MKEHTSEQSFYRDNDSSTAQFMHKEGTYRYLVGGDYRALEVPYKGNSISMLFILPDTGKMDAVESGLSSDFLSALTGSLQQAMVYVAIPKFKFTTSSTSLRQILMSLGMTSAFSDAADFSGIDGTHSLQISDAIHKAFVAVDERGTEAAAATAIIIRAGAVLVSNSFTANRPFIFLIRDNTRGTVLCIGKVVRPVFES